ncbi:MAG TPA: hypothetical protein VFK48_19320 [Usitatibacter sp.]|nr:hypothetical protein [Usitatibacter sp.]
MSVYGKLACSLVALLACPLSLAADPERGRALYELRCGTCHSESVHGRQKRVAADFDEVRAWVSRWSEHLGLRWTSDEIDDVSVHLNKTYYRFACPVDTCTVISRTSRGDANATNLQEIPFRVVVRSPARLRAGAAEGR